MRTLLLLTISCLLMGCLGSNRKSGTETLPIKINIQRSQDAVTEAMKANADAQRLASLIKDRNTQAADTISHLQELDCRIDAKEAIVAEWDRLHNK